MVSRAERHRRAKQAAAAQGQVPPKLKRTKQQILEDIRATFQNVEFGLADFLGKRPERRLVALRNLVVFGPATTVAIQNLRSVDPDFDSWWEPHRQAMEADPLLRYFYKLRSRILKEGTVGRVGNRATLNGSFSWTSLQQALGPQPPGATSSFMGDQVGGSGWIVPLPDGSEQKYYVDLPDDFPLKMEHTLHFDDPPTEHRGKPLADTSIEALTKLYVAWLQELVANTISHFAG